MNARFYLGCLVCVAGLVLCHPPAVAGDQANADNNEETRAKLEAEVEACFDEVLCSGDVKAYSDYCAEGAGQVPRRDITIGESLVLLAEARGMSNDNCNSVATCCANIDGWVEKLRLVELIVDHRTGTWRVDDHGLKVPWERDVNGDPTVFLSSKDTPVVWVDGSSPLLYSAEFGEVTEEEAPGQTDLTKLVTTLGGSIGTGITKWSKPGPLGPFVVTPPPGVLVVGSAPGPAKLKIEINSIEKDDTNVKIGVTVDLPVAQGVSTGASRQVPIIDPLNLFSKTEVRAQLVSGTFVERIETAVTDSKSVPAFFKKGLKEQLTAHRAEIEASLYWMSSGGSDVEELTGEVDDLSAAVKGYKESVADLERRQRIAVEILRRAIEASTESGDSCEEAVAKTASGATSTSRAAIKDSLATLTAVATPRQVRCDDVVRAYRKLLDVYPTDLTGAQKLVHEYRLAKGEAVREARKDDTQGGPACDTLDEFIATLDEGVTALSNAANAGDQVRFEQLLKTQREGLMSPAAAVLDAAEARAKGLSGRETAVKASDGTIKAASTLDRFVQRCYTSQGGTGYSARVLPPQGDPGNTGASRSVRPSWNVRRTYPVSITLDSAYKGDVHVTLPAERATKFKVVPRWRRNTAFSVGITWTDLVSPTWEAVACPPTDENGNNVIPACANAPEGDDLKYAKRTKEDSQAGKFVIFGSWLPFGRDVKSYPSKPNRVRGGIELGLGLDAARPALFAGAALHCGRWLKISGGYTAQYLAQLNGMKENGLVPGGVIVTKDGLDDSYYISLSLTLDGLSLFSAD